MFVERGYGPTTIDAIADWAGVNRKTVFTSVGGKFEALKLAIDWANVGDDEPVPMLERPYVKASHQEPDARRILTDFAKHVRVTMARVAPLHSVLHAAAGLDPDVKALSDDLREQRQRGINALARVLADRNALKPGLTTSDAADVLWLFLDPSMHTRFAVERGWSPERFQQWLADTMLSVLIAPNYRPKRLAPVSRDAAGRRTPKQSAHRA